MQYSYTEVMATDEDELIMWTIIGIGMLILFLMVTITICWMFRLDKRCKNTKWVDLLEDNKHNYFPPIVPSMENSGIEFQEGNSCNDVYQAKLGEEEEIYKAYFLQYINIKMPKGLINKKEMLQQHQLQIKVTYQCIVRLLIQSMLTYKRNLFQIPVFESGDDKVVDQKQQYRIYGLLLSASIKGKIIPRSLTPSKAVKEKVKEQYKFIDEWTVHLIDNYITKSLSMTWSMLTLLPPLLVVTTIDQYNEQLHDTNRHTWEENNGRPLYYYRPILVYGNRVHVAVKGQIGN